MERKPVLGLCDRWLIVNSWSRIEVLMMSLQPTKITTHAN
jgi:hypothetical protein